MPGVSPGAEMRKQKTSSTSRQLLQLLEVGCFILPPLAGLNETQIPSPITAKGITA